MGIIFDVPEYPVIDPSPRMWTTMKNYGWKDYAAIIGFPLAAAPFGYVWGAPHACTCSVLCLSDTLWTAHQLSRA